MLLKTI